jgi:hypothetical protein
MSVSLEQGALDAVTKEIASQMEQWQQVIIRNLQIAGEEAVKKARLIVTNSGGGGSVMPPYTVQTGNLVSSVGYALVIDGQIVKTSSFDSVSGPKGTGAEGAEKGRAYVKELAMRFPQGYALILVAGMHYASYVQEIHHRDVLVSGSLVAEQLVNELKDKLSKSR